MYSVNAYVVLLLTAVTLLTAALAVWAFGTASSRSAAIAQGLGVQDRSLLTITRHLTERAIIRLGIKSALVKRLAGAGVNWDPVTVLIVIVAVEVVILLTARMLIGNVGALIMMGLAPVFFFRYLRNRTLQRTERFISQLPDLARLLANGTSAGLSLERALVLAANEMPDPAAQELQRLTSQTRLGWPLEVALGQLGERMPSRELNVLVRTLLIQSRTGGGLVAALHDIALTLDERKELRREVKTIVLSSAISGYIVPVIAITSVALLNLFEPGILDEMVRSLIGQMIILSAVILFAVGALLMRIASKVEV